MSKRVGPCLYITNLPRSTPRALWKWLYRYKRVELREMEKAHTDTMLFGTGLILYPDDDDPKYIPLQDAYKYVTK